MKLFTLGTGLYCVQSGVFLTKFGHRLLLSLSALIMCERAGKINCYDALLYASKLLQTQSLFNNNAYFLIRFLRTKLLFDLF